MFLNVQHSPSPVGNEKTLVVFNARTKATAAMRNIFMLKVMTIEQDCQSYWCQTELYAIIQPFTKKLPIMLLLYDSKREL